MTFVSAMRDKIAAVASKQVAAFLLFVWVAIVVAAFYGVQKPITAEVVRGLALTGWTLTVTVSLVAVGAGIGTLLLKVVGPAAVPREERVLIGTGLGLGVLGVGGLEIAVLDAATPVVFAVALVATLGLLAGSGVLRSTWQDTRAAAHMLWDARNDAPLPLRVALVLALTLCFVLALAPPDAFDALQYHLTLPDWILRDGGLRSYDVYPFWHPGLVEGVFLWGLGLGSDRVPQMLHVAWATMAALLLWRWTSLAWSRKIAWYTLGILLTMPSLPRLAAWAYTDLALTYYVIVALFALWRWQETDAGRGWLLIGGVAAGMALSVKYTAFVLPLTVAAVCLWWYRRSPKTALTGLAVFGSAVAITVLPWYLRNWLYVDNPFYPFVFGGRYWDTFRSAWYTEAGRGIGWNPVELVLLPFNVTFGHRDATFSGGRIGPMFLALLPMVLWVLSQVRSQTRRRRRATTIIALFGALSALFWTLGVVRYSEHLWQARFLYPALIPLAPLFAVGLRALRRLDTPRLHISHVVNLVVAGVVALTLSETALLVVERNPLAVAVGVESRDAYMHRVQPGYARALDLLDRTPADARIYFLFEPRSYGATRIVQPDPILDNFAHALHVHGDAAAVVDALRADGYTHVLLYRWGVDFMIEERADKITPARVEALDRLTDELLVPIARTEGEGYELYALD